RGLGVETEGRGAAGWNLWPRVGAFGFRRIWWADGRLVAIERPSRRLARQRGVEPPALELPLRRLAVLPELQQRQGQPAGLVAQVVGVEGGWCPIDPCGVLGLQPRGHPPDLAEGEWWQAAAHLQRRIRREPARAELAAAGDGAGEGAAGGGGRGGGGAGGGTAAAA